MAMRRIALACAIASLLVGRLSAGDRSGDDYPTLDYPAGRLVEYNAREPEPASPSDVDTSLAPGAAAPCEKSPCEKSPCEEESPCEAAEDAWEPKHLLDNCCFLEKRGIKIGGWIAQGFVANPQSPGDRFNGPVTWMDRSNEYMLNEVYTYIAKDTDTGGSGADWGYRFDSMYGESARFTTSAGLEDHINKSQSFYGLALPQMYLEGAYNDLKVKAGHWISPVGYYTVGTYNNFFNTIPYTYQWGEPFTHTGMLSTYTATDNLVIGGGFTRGWDNSSNYNPHLGYIGTLTYSNLLKEGDSLAGVNMWSMEPNGFATGVQPSVNPIYATGKPAFSGRYFQTLVYSRPITEKLTYVAQSDFGYQTGAATSNGHALWYGLNQYMYYKYSDRWSWGINGEWFRDEEGFRVGGFLPNYTNDTNGGPSNTRGWGSSGATGIFAGGFAGSFYQITFGPRWTPNPNLVIRPNFRFDWYNGQNGTLGYLHPYDAGTRNQQGILMTDVVIVY